MRFEEWETLWIARESVGGVVDASMIGQEGSARTLVSRATLPSLRTFRATLAQILEAIEHLSDGRRIRRNASTFSNDLEKGKTRAEPSRAESNEPWLGTIENLGPPYRRQKFGSRPLEDTELTLRTINREND